MRTGFHKAEDVLRGNIRDSFELLLLDRSNAFTASFLQLYSLSKLSRAFLKDAICFATACSPFSLSVLVSTTTALNLAPSETASVSRMRRSIASFLSDTFPIGRRSLRSTDIMVFSRSLSPR